MIIKIIIIIFILFVFSRIIKQFKRGEITSREFFSWLFFWFLVIVAVMMPKKTDTVAQFLGVSRGADLLTYLSILVLFFIIFKILVRLEKIDHNITKIIRQDALLKRQKDE